MSGLDNTWSLLSFWASYRKMTWKSVGDSSGVSYRSLAGKEALDKTWNVLYGSFPKLGYFGKRPYFWASYREGKLDPKP